MSLRLTTFLRQNLLPLILIVGIYFLLASLNLTKLTTNFEAENYLRYNNILTNQPQVITPHFSFFQNLYFIPLSLWTKIFAPSLITYRTFSTFLGVLIIILVFLTLKLKLKRQLAIPLTAIFILNPISLNIATNFSPHTEYIFLILLILVLFFSIFLKINPQKITVHPPKLQITLSIFAISLILFTFLLNLGHNQNIRKIYIAIYQISQNRQSEALQSSQKNQSEISAPTIYFMQSYSPSFYVENLLVAKELNKTPLDLAWQDDLQEVLNSKNPLARFWIISFGLQSMDNMQKLFSDQDSSKSESGKKKSNIFQETDSLKIDDITAKYIMRASM